MPAKRTLDELVLRYRIGKVNEREIYVEGLQDKTLLEYFLRAKKLSAPVYTADTIDIPGGIVQARGLDLPSSRSTVIATRAELIERGIEVGGQLYVVDRDQEDLVQTPHIDGVSLTDFGSLLMHLLDDRAFERIALLVGRGAISVETLTEATHRIGGEVTLLRAAAKRLKVPLRILNPSPFIAGGPVNGFTFDADGYRRACLHSCDCIAMDVELSAAVEACRFDVQQMNLQSRVLLNDHDVWLVVRSILRLSGDAVNRSSDDIRDLVLMSFDHVSLEVDPLFRRILEHVDG